MSITRNRFLGGVVIIRDSRLFSCGRWPCERNLFGNDISSITGRMFVAASIQKLNCFRIGYIEGNNQQQIH